MKYLLLHSRVAVKASNMKISRLRLADCVKNCTKKRAARAARLFFPIQSIILLFSAGVVVDVDVAVVVSLTP